MKTGRRGGIRRGCRGRRESREDIVA